jgi:hypothetical protein
MYALGLRADELMLVLLLRLKTATEDVDELYAELLELCGDNLVDIIALLIANKTSLLAEFQVGFLYFRARL